MSKSLVSLFWGKNSNHCSIPDHCAWEGKTRRAVNERSYGRTASITEEKRGTATGGEEVEEVGRGTQQWERVLLRVGWKEAKRNDSTGHQLTCYQKWTFLDSIIWILARDRRRPTLLSKCCCYYVAAVMDTEVSTLCKYWMQYSEDFCPFGIKMEGWLEKLHVGS